MDIYTPAPDGVMLRKTPPPLTEGPTLTNVVTQPKVIHTDDGAFAALIGGTVGGVLLLLICTIAVLLWCLTRQKGSYITNELDDNDDDDIDDDYSESVGSDTALQSREPLKIKEEE